MIINYRLNYQQFVNLDIWPALSLAENDQSKFTIMKNLEKLRKKLNKVNSKIDKMAVACPFDLCEDTYLKNIDFAMEFALDNKELYNSISNSDIRYMYADAQDLKKLVWLMSKKARLLTKINLQKQSTNNSRE